MTCAIQILNVSKVFSSERRRPSFYAFLQRLLGQKRVRPEAFHALKHIDFEVQQGEKIGLIGDNGSGKTTLLKLISGLYKPDEGKVQINGEMLLMSGLGTGMLEELSLVENLMLFGSIYGVDRTAMKAAIPEMLQWADLEEFASAKLKTLSSGMRSRLGFSAIRHIEADIFLLDEALTAGDKNFKAKCQAVFDAYQTSARTFLVATHDLAFVKRFCSKTLWLQKGRQMAFDHTEQVVAEYNLSTLK